MKPRRKIRLVGMVGFSPKELKIIRLLTEGLKNKEIACAIGTTDHVIKNYLRVIYDKTGHHNRTELALWWVYHTEVKGKQNAKKASSVFDGSAVDAVGSKPTGAGATAKGSDRGSTRPIGGADMYIAHHRREAR